MNRHAPYDRTCRVRYGSPLTPPRRRPRQACAAKSESATRPIPGDCLRCKEIRNGRQRKEEQGAHGPVHHFRARPQSDEPRSCEQREERQHAEEKWQLQAANRPHPQGNVNRHATKDVNQPAFVLSQRHNYSGCGSEHGDSLQRRRIRIPVSRHSREQQQRCGLCPRPHFLRNSRGQLPLEASTALGG